ncbi:hypothetical protein D3C81_2065130 [compost metagenome]
MGRGGHFLGGCRDQVDFPELLLHAGQPRGRYGRGLVRGRPCVVHRAGDRCNDRLQLVEKAVERHDQLAYFIVLVVPQSEGQVPVTVGDLIECECDAVDRSTDRMAQPGDQ